MKRERRGPAWSADIEIRKDDESGSTTLVSHAPPWESLSGDLGGFVEKFERGAFNNLDHDIVATFDHNNSQLLGRTSAGTLSVSEDDKGLRYAVELPGTSIGSDLEVLIARGDIRGSSFEFSVEPGGESWSEDDDGNAVRTVTNARLYQVGPVVNPAYQDTSVALRSMETWAAEKVIEGDADKIAAHRRRLKLAEIE